MAGGLMWEPVLRGEQRQLRGGRQFGAFRDTSPPLHGPSGPSCTLHPRARGTSGWGAPRVGLAGTRGQRHGSARDDCGPQAAWEPKPGHTSSSRSTNSVWIPHRNQSGTRGNTGNSKYKQETRHQTGPRAREPQDRQSQCMDASRLSTGSNGALCHMRSQTSDNGQSQVVQHAMTRRKGAESF